MRSAYHNFLAGILFIHSCYSVPGFAKDTCSEHNREKIKFITQTHADRWNLYPEGKQVMIDEMSKSLRDFYGINTQLFYWELRQLAPSFGNDYQIIYKSLGRGPIYGDAHFGNLGSFTYDEQTHYAMNDYDDVTIGPRILDIMRAAASLPLHFPEAPRSALIQNFVEGYISALNKIRQDQSPSKNYELQDADQKKIEEPAPPPTASNKAKQFLAQMAGLSAADFSTECKKFTYAPFHGGSSIGLPRFRAKCNDVTYEVKACVGSAIDQSLNRPSSARFNGTRVTELAKKLAPAYVGGFIPTTIFSSIPEFAAFGFYGYQRLSEKISTENASDKEANDWSYELGRALGEGHQKSINSSLKWTTHDAQVLKKMLGETVPKILAVFAKDFEDLPKCF